MSLLKKYFDKKSCHSSPIVVDKQRIVKYDEKGNEYITFEPIDYSKLVQSHGPAEDWSLTNLLKSGINPAFSIHTANPTRLEGLNTVNQASQIVDDLFKDHVSNELQTSE